MSRQSSAAVRRTVPKGARVMSNRVGPGVPDSIIDELLDEGIVGMLDYDIGHSADPDDIDSPSGQGALKNVATFSRTGGYVVSHKVKYDRVVVGRASPSSFRFEELEGGDYDGKVLKCVDLDVHAEISEDGFEGVFEVVRKRPRQVFNPIGDVDHRERVVAAVTVLEREGKLQRS